MARDRVAVLLARADQAKDSVAKCEAHLEGTRVGFRRALLACYREGVSISRLANHFHTSQSRMSLNIRKAQAESERLGE